MARGAGSRSVVHLVPRGNRHPVHRLALFRGCISPQGQEDIWQLPRGFSLYWRGGWSNRFRRGSLRGRWGRGWSFAGPASFGTNKISGLAREFRGIAMATGQAVHSGESGHGALLNALQDALHCASAIYPGIRAQAPFPALLTGVDQGHADRVL